MANPEHEYKLARFNQWKDIEARTILQSHINLLASQKQEKLAEIEKNVPGALVEETFDLSTDQHDRKNMSQMITLIRYDYAMNKLGEIEKALNEGHGLTTLPLTDESAGLVLKVADENFEKAERRGIELGKEKTLETLLGRRLPIDLWSNEEYLSIADFDRHDFEGRNLYVIRTRIPIVSFEILPEGSQAEAAILVDNRNIEI